MERTTDYARCPVHKTLLKPDYCYGINVWYCARCGTYYAKGQNGSMASNITMSGTPILFKEELSTISKKELAQQQKVSEERRFAEKYESLPDSSELLICPIHHKLLQAKDVALNFKGSKVITPIGYCQHCDIIYMNSLNTALLGNTDFLGKHVTWMPIKFTHMPKSNESIQPNIKLKIKTNNIAIISAKKDITAPKIFVAPAVAQVALQHGVYANIDGYYVASVEQFYTTPNALFSQILSTEQGQLQITDPKNIIKKYKQTPAFRSQQKAIEEQNAKAAQKERTKRDIENKTLKPVFYTQPLLKGDDKYCPFCHHALQKRYMNMAIYHEKIMTGIRRTSCLFCDCCNAPFISLTQEINTLNAICPRMIYVFDARTCSNAQELLQRATQELKKRIDSKNKRVRLPLEEELKPEKPLPNLSFDSKASKVLVYANNCHCTACRKKYQQNTIRNRAALVKTVEGNTVKVNVEFCVGCGRYFMNITSFKQYRKKYGQILMECMMDQELANQNSMWLDFAPDTILSRCGYSVKKGISRTHREAVLAYILDSGKASKYEVLEIISRFIRMRKNYQPGACARWREDIEFVNQYNIQSQETVEGLTFQQAGPYRP